MITFTDLMDDAALISLEHQLRMMDVVGNAGWSLNLETAHFELLGDERTLTCTDVQLLGSAAPGPNSWLWGWANPAGYREDVLAAALQARAFGEQHGIPELAQPEVPFSALPGSPTDPAIVASYMMEAVKAVTGRYSGYQGPAGGGTRVGVLIDHPELRLPAPEGPRVSRVLQQGLMELLLHSHRRAVDSYARRRDGLDVQHAGPDSRITGPALSMDLRFDDHDRMTSMSVHMGGSSQPSDIVSIDR